MRSPIHALLWENWRLTRVEVAVRMALGIVAGAAVMVMFGTGAIIAFWILITMQSCAFLSILRLNGGRFMDGYKPGFPFYLLYTRPVATAVFVGVAMTYDAVACTAMYLISAALLGLAFGQPLPSLSMTFWILAFHFCYTCVQWSTTNRVFQYVGSIVSLLPLFWMLRSRVQSQVPVEFSLTENALMLVMSVVAFGLTVAAVARQRHGGAIATVRPTAVSGGYPDWLVSLFRFPCPTSSATKAQVWFELKTSGLPVLAIGLALGLTIPLLFIVSIPFAYVRPVALALALVVAPAALLISGVNAFGIRRKQGRTYASTFEATKPCDTARLAGLKVLVRSGCMLVALIAVGASLWTSSSLVSAWGSWETQGIALDGAPGLTMMRNSIGDSFATMTGYAQVALAVIASIAIVFVVASLAAFHALRARYSRRMIIAGSLLLLHGLALVLLALGAQKAITSPFLVETAFVATGWAFVAAIVCATIYLFWSGFAERALTIRYASAAVLLSAAFAAAWLAMLNAAGVPLAGLSAAGIVAFLWPVLLPLMAGVVAPWSLSRVRHT